MLFPTCHLNIFTSVRVLLTSDITHLQKSGTKQKSCLGLINYEQWIGLIDFTHGLICIRDFHKNTEKKLH